MAATSGWTDPALTPYVYVHPPADGIQEYDFVAVRPTGITMPVLTPISASDIIVEIPEWLKGVRIFAETNQIQKKRPAQ